MSKRRYISGSVPAGGGAKRLAKRSTPGQSVKAPESNAQSDDQISVRVDPDLHLHLLALLVDLRRKKYRSTQTELVEMFLTELPHSATAELIQRITAFRARQSIHPNGQDRLTG